VQISSTNPHQLYRELDAIQAESRRSEAVVRTKKAGFDLGGFGLEYESEEIVLDDSRSDSPSTRAAHRLTREFETVSSIGRLRAEVADSAVESRLNWADSLPQGALTTPRRGARMYAENGLAGLSQPVRSGVALSLVA
jgi:hypothetical protein